MPTLTDAEMAALRFLDAQVRGLNAYEIGDEHVAAVVRLASMRVGGRKLVSQRIGRQAFTEWRLTDAGRALVREQLPK